MAEEVIKTSSCPDAMMGALAGSMFGNRSNDPLAMAAMLGRDRDDQWNNPFIYLVWMMFANRFFGNGEWGNGQNAQNVEMQNQLQAIRTQMQDNQNSNLLMDAIKGNATALGQLSQSLNCDFNALNSAVCDVRQGIALLAGKTDSNAEKIINAANLGDLNIVQQLKDCCCQTQQSILNMGYQNQLGQKDILGGMQQQTNTLQQGLDFVNRSVERGFSALGYQNAQDKCDIINAASANTQRIVDVLNTHWQSDLQQRYNDARLELSQQKQNAALIAALKTTTTATT